MSVTVDFYWDIGSTNTYFAFRLLPGVLARTGAQVRYHPFNLGYVFRHYSYALTDEPVEKMRYRKRDLERWAEHLHLPFQIPKKFPIKTAAALRGAFVARQMGREVAYMEAIFTAYWEQGICIEDTASILPLLAPLGIDASEFQSRSNDEDIRQMLIDSTTAGLAQGVFGAPMFVLEKELFWGKDRLDFLEREIRNRIDDL